MNTRTEGYIVIGGDGHPLRWYEDEGRFYVGIFPYRPAVTIFPAGEYETARRAIRRHNRAVKRLPFKYTADLEQRFRDLRIVRLITDGGAT
jgi:hypothetical protein